MPTYPVFLLIWNNGELVPMENSELPAGVVEPMERGPNIEEVAVVDVAKRADAKRLVATVVEPFAESKISPGIESMVVPLERYPAR